MNQAQCAPTEPPPLAAADALMLEMRGRIRGEPGRGRAGKPPAGRHLIESEERIGQGCPASSLLSFGWSVPETNFIWSCQEVAGMTLPPPPRPCTVLLDFIVSPFSAASVRDQRVRVRCLNRPIAAGTVGNRCRLSVIVPRDCAGPDGFELAWEFPDAASPRSLGLSPDTRRLGLALHSLRTFFLDW
jgi:hypothetical protein